MSNEKVAAVESGGHEHGALVQQILETQKELQDGNKRERVEIEREAAVRIYIVAVDVGGHRAHWAHFISCSERI